MSKSDQNERVYQYICRYIQTNGRLPTRKEIGESCDLIPYHVDSTINRLRGAGRLSEVGHAPTALIFPPV